MIGCSRPGKGAAVRRGLLTSGRAFVGFFDADLATPVETLPTAMTLLPGGAAAVVASRYAPGSALLRRQPLGRRAGGAVFRRMTRTVVTGVRDTQCGFKFFDRHAVSGRSRSAGPRGSPSTSSCSAQIQADGGAIVEIPSPGPTTPARPSARSPTALASFAALLQLRRG